jgi:hypothetical protein
MTTTPSPPRLEFFEWKRGHCQYRETTGAVVYYCLLKEMGRHKRLCKTHHQKLRSKTSMYCQFDSCLLEKKQEKNAKYCWRHSLCTEINCEKDKKKGVFCEAHYAENLRHPNSLQTKLPFERLKEECEIEQMIANDPMLKAIDERIMHPDDASLRNASVGENKLFGRAFQERVAMFSGTLPKLDNEEQTRKKQKI